MSRVWAFVACSLSFVVGLAVAGAGARAPLALDTGLAAFLEQVRESEQHIRQAPAFGSDAERAGGYLHLARAIVRGLQEGVLQDPDHPYFRTLDFWSREGGDNPDQRYAFSPIRGGEAYRIWGNLGSAARVELQVYAGRPWAGTGRSAGYLPFEEIDVKPDGSFEVELSPDRSADGTWLACAPDATTVFVRHIWSDWSDGDPGHVHIDRVGYEGTRKLPETSAAVAEKLGNAAAILGTVAKRWPDFVQQRYRERGPANVLSPLVDTYALGGVRGRWMSTGHFELPPGQALLLKTWPTKAHYQGIQLADLWFASLEYGNQVSSLTGDQLVKAPDGAYYTVVSAEDPGHANWLDTGGLTRGVFMLRYDGVQGELPEAQHPSMERVALSEVSDRIPGFTRVDEEQREAVRAARRRHLQLRSGR